MGIFHHLEVKVISSQGGNVVFQIGRRVAAGFGKQVAPSLIQVGRLPNKLFSIGFICYEEYSAISQSVLLCRKPRKIRRGGISCITAVITHRGIPRLSPIQLGHRHNSPSTKGLYCNPYCKGYIVISIVQGKIFKRERSWRKISFFWKNFVFF